MARSRAVHYAHSTWGQTLCGRDLLGLATLRASQFDARVTCGPCRDRLAEKRSRRAALERLAVYLDGRSPAELEAIVDRVASDVERVVTGS